MNGDITAKWSNCQSVQSLDVNRPDKHLVIIWQIKCSFEIRNSKSLSQKMKLQPYYNRFQLSSVKVRLIKQCSLPANDNPNFKYINPQVNFMLWLTLTTFRCSSTLQICGLIRYGEHNE